MKFNEKQKSDIYPVNDFAAILGRFRGYGIEIDSCQGFKDKRILIFPNEFLKTLDFWPPYDKIILYQTKGVLEELK